MTVLLLLATTMTGALVGLFVGAAVATARRDLDVVSRFALLGALAGLACGIGAAL